MHWIRVHTLERLSFAEQARNRDLRPVGVESNLFQYHLNQLVRQGYVNKQDKYYRLAPIGLRWADRYSLQLKRARPQPKVITIIGIANDNGEFLLKPKLLQPFVGQYYIPSGKLREAEPLEVATQREVSEKLEGAVVQDMEAHGSVRVSITQDNIIVTDYVGFLFRARLSRQCRLPHSVRWYAPNSTKLSVMPGTDEVLRIFNDVAAPREIQLCR